MNFGQALSSLLSGRSITRAGWNRQGMSLALQAPTGKVTQPFIVEQLANGECTVYSPNQADILATDWNTIGQETGAVREQPQHEHAGARG